ncbi:MAG: hypothetical protein GQ574_26285 [Crocinitomix sp.]|nr:hypothetical protein [Crocinitomix sp.]
MIKIKNVKRYLPLFIGIILFQCLIGCEEKTPSPEMVSRDWLAYMSAGECEKAIDLEYCAGEESRIILNCEPYESEIKSINCEVREETAACTCIESRGLSQEEHYNFDLKKIDGKWIISSGF